MSASQHLSKKTYLEMGDEDKLIIEAYHYGYGVGIKDIQNYINWPWQSINAHINVIEKRIANRKETLQKVKSRADETIARLDLFKPENHILQGNFGKLSDEQCHEIAKRIKPPTVLKTNYAQPEEKKMEEKPKVNQERMLLYDEPGKISQKFIEHLNNTLPQDPLRRNPVEKQIDPFYISAIKELAKRFASGDIIFTSLLFDEKDGRFFLRFTKKD